MHRASLAVAAIFVLAGCGSSTEPVTSPPPADTAIPTETPDPAETSTLQDSIVIVYGDKPQPGWWKYLIRHGKKPEVAVFGTAAWIGAKPGVTAKVAKTMCADIAGASHDENGDPIGFRHVHVVLHSDPAMSIADDEIQVIASCETDAP